MRWSNVANLPFLCTVNPMTPSNTGLVFEIKTCEGMAVNWRDNSTLAIRFPSSASKKIDFERDQWEGVRIIR